MNSRIPRTFGTTPTTGYHFELQSAGKCRPSNVDAGDPEPGQAFTKNTDGNLVPSSSAITDDPFWEDAGGGTISIRTDF